MRIAYFTETYYPQLNGVVTSLNNFSNVYRAQGHTTYIIAPKLKGYKDSDPNIIRIPSLKIWPTFPDLARVPLLLPGGYFRKLLKLDADIVHAHGNGGYSLIGLLFAKLKKIPYVLTFHNLHTVYASLLFKGIVLTPEMVEKFLKNFAENCDLVVTPSYKMELELISYGVKKPIEIIPNFLDLKKFNVWDKHFLHKLLNLPPATPILLAAGRIEPEKNFEFLIKSFHKISKEDQTSHLVIVGEGRVENELRQLAED
ncbi:glycosyltransferase, partial [Candidatus Daviesbacteria bacterium]|nr:glycosyltransferase [Candidatus Daviesbacteria bacterium]